MWSPLPPPATHVAPGEGYTRGKTAATGLTEGLRREGGSGGGCELMEQSFWGPAGPAHIWLRGELPTKPPMLVRVVVMKRVPMDEDEGTYCRELRHNELEIPGPANGVTERKQWAGPPVLQAPSTAVAAHTQCCRYSETLQTCVSMSRRWEEDPASPDPVHDVDTACLYA
ncbi:hypothetical protein TREES_T100020705 [Tupaia chinensis]|uniref:Uncharacterized protein n=1 Tax=Tupaia chinensis TaxID=246437 RepID=L9KLE1_TUPCH|nr:hypothetical protein TREES_T100020705 [Tupaia chinensis]